MLRHRSEVFAPTDGVVAICMDSAARLAVGADFSDPSLLEVAYPLDIRRMRISARDVELAESIGCELTAKVEVRNAPSLTPECDAVMDGHVYEVTRVEDRGHTCWLWMSEIATDGTAKLHTTVTTRDSHGIPTTTNTKPEVWCRKVTRSVERVAIDGIDMRPHVTLRLRQSDYANQATVERAGVTYSVIEAKSAGRWVDLTCERKVSDR